MNAISPTLIQSVHDRLNACRTKTGQNFEDILYAYAIERFLYRLSRSRFQDQFVLKGGTIFTAWGVALGRSTRDIDLRGYVANDIDILCDAVREIIQQDVDPDALVFEPDTITSKYIEEANRYPGVRIKFLSYLGNAQIRMQIDVGFSDEITPTDRELIYPTLLTMPSPVLRCYPPETVIAEKLQAIVELDIINSRMKDFYDIWLLSKRLQFDGALLQKAIIVTFRKRETLVPAGTPTGLTIDFANSKQGMWMAFRRKLVHPSDVTSDFTSIITELQSFLLPPLLAAAVGNSWEKNWSTGEEWT